MYIYIQLEIRVNARMSKKNTCRVCNTSHRPDEFGKLFSPFKYKLQVMSNFDSSTNLKFIYSTTYNFSVVQANYISRSIDKNITTRPLYMLLQKFKSVMNIDLIKGP